MPAPARPAVPIEVLPLFPVLDQRLAELLRSLSPTDWQRPTLARQWTVKDVAAHLLDGNLRTLSMLRDGHFGEAPDDPDSYQGILTFLNRLNAEWVRAARRLSPAVLMELLAQSGAEYTAYLNSLDPFAPATFAVAWAGEAESRNWFHIAREYTEKWHHQQQIHAAVGGPGLLTPELFGPFAETCLRGLPHAYRHVAAPVGTVVHVCITTNLGGTWQLRKVPAGWELQAPDAVAVPATVVSLSPDVAWRLFTKGMSPAEARPHVQLVGSQPLGEAALGLLAVMA
ncbi:maleylpyruvate isomerase N-terminal domain-containing protein [Hymenobacter arizonensis]|uniref:TIGR03083 family protein n=1 Tax=Hymenobacter arizonensis TaxID=1227077 RepID=A0A1I6AJQ5_HYMAR|nr:maleylpyruvate isomerase N-terminal domain-containing protein [Hymenobacter arizonensis]SFQ68880.1 TIGR03083 family protein [Hymenobacter arizonensis]